MKVCALHVESCKPRSLGKEGDNHCECHHLELGPPDEGVEKVEIEYGAELAILLRDEQVWRSRIPS